MTLEELNEVRTLRKRIAKGKQKLQALKDCIESSGVKYTRETETIKTKDGKKTISYPALDVSPKSHSTESQVETLVALIIDTEKEIEKMHSRLIAAVPELTSKIQAEVKDNVEQTLLIYRYVACEYFRDIGFKIGYSEQWVYWKHNQIVKKFRVD